MGHGWIGGVAKAIRPRRLTLQGHLILMIAALVLSQFVITGGVISSAVSDIVREQLGQRALQTALAVAEMPGIRSRLAVKDQSGTIQILAETVRRKVGAEYVVIGDENGIRYSHPRPDRIGKPFVGGDTGPALGENRAYVSEAVGTLGPAIRGFAPVHDEAGATIGFVSVGYLLEDLRSIQYRYLTHPLFYVCLLMVGGIVWALYVARQMKKRTLGLEPEEMADLYLQRGTVLEAIRYGVVSVDDGGVVRLVNKAAMRAAGAESAEAVIGRSAHGVFPDLGLDAVLATGHPIEDQERRMLGRDMIVTAVALRGENRIRGAVATFRPKDEVDRIGRELTQVQKYVELLRTQSHEYSNKLHTVAGLLQIEAYQEALDCVFREVSGYQDLIGFLHRAVPHPVIAAIILGKFTRGREVKVDLVVAPDSQMIDVPSTVDQDQLVTILGNLIENAFEAVLGDPEGDRQVHLSFTDLGDELLFEVEDSGPGVDPDRGEAIFEKGDSSKPGQQRGFGLFLVRQALDRLGGYVTLGNGEMGGALFTVAIPKYRTFRGGEASGP